MESFLKSVFARMKGSLVFVTYLQTFTFGAGYLFCCGISWYLGHIPPLPRLPLLSTIGTFSPEGYLVGLLVNWGAMFVLIHAYIFQSYIELIDPGNPFRYQMLTKAAVMSLGMAISGSFPISKLMILHRIGTVSGFFATMAYTVGVCTQSWDLLQRKILPSTDLVLLCFRMFLVVLQLIGFVLFIFFAYFLKMKEHPASTMEWMMYYSQVTFSATMLNEIRKVRLVEIRFALNKTELGAKSND